MDFVKLETVRDLINFFERREENLDNIVKHFEKMNIHEKDIYKFIKQKYIISAVPLPTVITDHILDYLLNLLFRASDADIQQKFVTYQLDGYHPLNNDKIILIEVGNHVIAFPKKYEVIKTIKTIYGERLPKFHENFYRNYGFNYNILSDMSYLFSRPLTDKKFVEKSRKIFILREIDNRVFRLSAYNTGRRFKIDIKLQKSRYKENFYYKDIIELAEENMAHLQAKDYYRLIITPLSNITPIIDVPNMLHEFVEKYKFTMYIVPYEVLSDFYVRIPYKYLEILVKDFIYKQKDIEKIPIDKFRKVCHEIITELQNWRCGEMF